MPAMLSPLAIIKLVLWIAIVIVGTLLLRRRAVTTRARIAFLLGGTLLFGFVFGVLSPAGSLDPNPVFSVRSFVRGLVGAGPLQQAPQQASPVSKPGAALLPIVGMLLVLLGLVWASNKSLCGWGCPLGLLQDLLHHVPLPKWKPSFRLSNTIRIVAFAALVAGWADGLGGGTVQPATPAHQPRRLPRLPAMRQGLPRPGHGRYLCWQEAPRRLLCLRSLPERMPVR